MKIPWMVACGIAAITLMAPTCLMAAPEPATVFVHTATENYYLTTLNHPSLNGKPTQRVLITQRYNGTTNDHPVGLYYNASSNRWCILNEDLATIPNGTAFNVRVTPPGATRTTRFVTSGKNSSYSGSMLTTRAGNSSAILLATHLTNASPTRDTSVLFKVPFGIAYGYGPAGDRWAIENFSDYPAVATAFNVFDATEDGRAMTVSAPGGSYYFAISNPKLDGNPDAVVFLTQNSTGSSYNVQTAVGYVSGQWMIYTPGTTNIPAGTKFNVKFYSEPTP